MSKISLIFLMGFIATTIGCASHWDTIKESKVTGDLTSYDTINLGWIDLGEEKWREYGFDESNKVEWSNTIHHMNKVSLPDYLRNMIPDKKIHAAIDKTDSTTLNGLVIKFTDSLYVKRQGKGIKPKFWSFGGFDSLDVTVHFIDGNTGKELYVTTITISSKPSVGYSGMVFESRVNNCVYYLADFISKKVN